ncbi:MAG: cobalamin-dependent protein [Deltaproteobacteria bacterium]|nr:cobalamin-dependent protein [Deltaproteobacteria bacterium]
MKLSGEKINGEYDIVLIQPPLFSSFIDYCESLHIEKEYWYKMEKNSGRLLGDLPFEASYGILSISSYLKSFGYKVKIIDIHLTDYFLRKNQAKGINETDIVKILSKYKSKFYGLTVLTISEKWSNTVTDIIRKLYNKAYIFGGGYFPAKNDSFILKKNSNIDFIVRNEGEFIIKNILGNFFSKKELELY